MLQRSEGSGVERRLDSVLPWVVLPLYTLCGLIFWVDRRWHPEWDSAIYLLTGKSLASGAGYVYLDQPFFLRPPGFAWMLSLMVRDGTYDFLSVNRMVMLFAGATVAAIFLVLRKPYGSRIALAVALLTGTCPLFVGNFNWVMSDFPFAALLFLSIAMLHRAGQREHRWWAWAAGGAVVLGMAIYLRTAGVLVLPAMLLLGAGRDRRAARWRAVVPVVAVILLVLPWALYAKRAAAAAQAPSEQMLNFDYSASVFHVDPGDPGSPRVSASGWVERVRRNGGRLAQDVAVVCLGTGRVWARVSIAAVLFSGLVLAVRRRPSLLEWLAVAYGLVVVTYFTYDLRLLLPLWPLVYLYLFVTVSATATSLARRLERPHLAGAVCVSLFVVLFVANVSRMPAMLHPERRAVGGMTQGEYWDATRAIADWIREHTPEDAVVLAYDAPVVSVLSGRKTYTYRYARAPGLLTRYEPDYVVLYPGGPPSLRENVARAATETWRIPVGAAREGVPIYRLTGR